MIRGAGTEPTDGVLSAGALFGVILASGQCPRGADYGRGHRPR